MRRGALALEITPLVLLPLLPLSLPFLMAANSSHPVAGPAPARPGIPALFNSLPAHSTALTCIKRSQRDQGPKAGRRAKGPIRKGHISRGKKGGGAEPRRAPASHPSTRRRGTVSFTCRLGPRPALPRPALPCLPPLQSPTPRRPRTTPSSLAVNATRRGARGAVRALPFYSPRPITARAYPSSICPAEPSEAQRSSAKAQRKGRNNAVNNALAVARRRTP